VRWGVCDLRPSSGDTEDIRSQQLSALLELTDRLYRAEKLSDIYDAALAAIVTTLGCSRASILLFDDSGVMRFVAHRGLSEPYLAAVEGHSPWKPGQRYPDPIFVKNIEDTEESPKIKKTIRDENISGLAFLPLVSHGVVIGKFMTYYEHPHEFSHSEIELSITIARQLGFGIERVRAEKARAKAVEELQESEARFRLMSENAPVMIWMSDAQGGCLHLNRMQRKFWNVKEEEIRSFDWTGTMHPDDANNITKNVMDAISNRTAMSVEGRYRNAQGHYRTLHTNAQPRFSPDGDFIGMIGVNVDITERKEAEQRSRESDERFRLAVEAAPCGMLMVSGNGQIELMNAKAEKLFEYSKDELLYQKIESLIASGSKEKVGKSSVNGLVASEHSLSSGENLVARTKSGKEVPVEISLNPITFNGRALAIATIVDISERKRADAQRELLLAELNHRVKNTLAVVQALAQQTFKEKESGETKAFEGRLIALATAHNLLTRANWERAPLRELVRESLQIREGSNSRISISGPEVHLAPKSALALTLAMHELFTNALKYGALSNKTGSVDLVWSLTDGPLSPLTIVWVEQGGPLVSPPKRRGFGTTLLERSLAADLNGEVKTEFLPQGLLCTISAPTMKSGLHGID
jgi:PAS domain S-box-containing protein